MTSTTPSYVAYVSLLVAGLAHFGWVLSSNDALAIVAGFVTLASVIFQHYHVAVANSAIAKQ